MSSNHIRLELSTTHTHEAPAHAEYATAGMAPEHTATPAASPNPPLALTLATIPLEAFALIACRLPAADVLNLSQTASHFRQALSIELYGSSLLQRSRDLRRNYHSYDEDTQTLDLRLLEYTDIEIESFKDYLHTIEFFLLHHRIWARTHVRTLIIPLERIIAWELADILNKIVTYLPGVTHLHLILSPHLKLSLDVGNKIRLFENLAALKVIAAHKVTIENSTLVENLAETLHNAFADGLFHPEIRILSIAHSAGNEFYMYSISLPDNPVYSHLNTLDCSLTHPAVLEISRLPRTITCLRTSSTTYIEGHAPSIERLEVLDTKTNGIGAIEYFPESQKALHALKTLYIEPPPDPVYHLLMLQALIQQAPSDLSITFAALHIQQIDLLEKLLQALHRDIHLPKEITFQLNNLANVHCFTRLAEQGMFKHLTTVRYQVESLLTPVSPFAMALAAALQDENLPAMTNFIFIYQYTPIIKDWPEIPFLESAEGRAYLLQNKTSFTLQDILKQPDYNCFLQSFTTLEASKMVLFRIAYPDETQRRKFMLSLYEALAEEMESYQYLVQQVCPAVEWLLHLENLYLNLYNIYIQYLQQSGISRSVVQAFRLFFKQKFHETEVGQQIITNIQMLLLRETADNISAYLVPELAQAGLVKDSTLVHNHGFYINFVRQADRH